MEKERFVETGRSSPTGCLLLTIAFLDAIFTMGGIFY